MLQGLGEPRKTTFPFGRKAQLTDFSQISVHASGAWCHSHPWSHPLSGIFIVTSLNDMSAQRAHGHLRSCLHLSAHCMGYALSRKVLSLTKPKCKIYKTKSLGHYITHTKVARPNTGAIPPRMTLAPHPTIKLDGPAKKAGKKSFRLLILFSYFIFIGVFSNWKPI